MSVVVAEPTEALDIVVALARCSIVEIWRLLRLRARARVLLNGNGRPQMEEQPALTPREADALEAVRRLGGRGSRPVTTTAVAAALVVDESWAYRLLARLREKGCAERVGCHREGGWVILHL
jgi:DNA-binding MarR family transcriptional regulator